MPRARRSRPPSARCPRRSSSPPGATESSNLALLGYANRNRRAGDHVVISEVDHISIHNLGKALEKAGFRVSKVPPDQFGRIDPEKLRKRITAETILVSVGWASNEIGTVQPMAEIAEVVAGTARCCTRMRSRRRGSSRSTRARSGSEC